MIRNIAMKEKDRPEFTWKNWWYYNKWFVILGVVAVFSVVSVIVGNITKTKPDYQIAYIGEYPLPNDTVLSIESALAEMGKDLNGDGKVVFKLNQYPTVKNADPEIALGQVGWETQLMADLLDCESYFFLLENAEEFNMNYNILDDDLILITSVGSLSGIERIKDMQLSRRTFEGKTVKNKNGCDEFWRFLKES